MVKRLGAVIVLSLMCVSSFADELAYRQSVMKSIGGHMTAIGNILRNRVHQEDLALHARGLASLASVAPNVFPEGSGGEKSKSLPAVWEEPEKFSAAMDDFVTAAQALPAALESGDPAQIMPAVGAVGQSCKGCHDDFKAE